MSIIQKNHQSTIIDLKIFESNEEELIPERRPTDDY